MSNLGMVLGTVAVFARFAGGFAVIGLFLAGVYTLFVDSAAEGLMMIGGAVVGGFIVSLVSGILLAVALSTVREMEGDLRGTTRHRI